MRALIRKARIADAHKLAELMNIAGEGIPAYLWAQQIGAGEDPLAYGAARVARTEGGFSYSNMHVADCDGAIAGMLLGYRLADPCESGPPEQTPDVVRPLIELESMAPGSWYVNAVATDANHRGLGLGRALMNRAAQLAGESGASSLSLIVAYDNVPARTLYEKLGYAIRARRPIVPFPGCPHSGDWVLMVKPVEPIAHR